jgi:adenine-specific DNA-methyltransferase
MPTLNWIGKDAVVNHHHQVPYHLLDEVPELSCGDAGSGNLIVEGDNLVALKALLPYYAGQVKCIYIDPPYNTGNENWIYNDNVNSPIIREWLGKTVGGEGETLDRHDRWLCMMYPRLSLLRQFLREDGAIFISIDDTEVQALRYVVDEVFGPQNFVTTIVLGEKLRPEGIGEVSLRESRFHSALREEQGRVATKSDSAFREAGSGVQEPGQRSAWTLEAQQLGGSEPVQPRSL